MDRKNVILTILAISSIALLFTNPAALGDVLAAVGEGLSATAAALSKAAQSATGGGP